MLLENIKIIAKSKKIPLYKIEKELNVSKGSISKWNKSKPSYDKLAKCAQILGVTVEELSK